MDGQRGSARSGPQLPDLRVTGGPKVRSILRDPLLHFLLLGAALFALHGVLGGRALSGSTRIVVDDDLARWLASSQARRLGRQPTVDELRGAISRHVRDEVLLAEARRRGLEIGDTVVDRRLIQKMEFLLESGASPTDEDLTAHQEAHPERYAAPTRVELTHRFFSSRRGDPEGDAAAALTTEEPGDPFAGGRRFRGRVERIRQQLALSVDLTTLTPGHWTGPHASAYGWHVLRIESRQEGGTRPLDEVRAEVERDWRIAEQDRSRALAIEGLVAEATIRIDADLADAVAPAAGEAP